MTTRPRNYRKRKIYIFVYIKIKKYCMEGKKKTLSNQNKLGTGGSHL
jgi:hypothetical protein